METNNDELPRIKEFEKKYLLAMEKEMTGLYMSGHPLSEYEDELQMYTSINTSEILSNISHDGEEMVEGRVDLDNKTVTMGGIVNSVKIKATRSNSMMAFAGLEDLYGSIEVIIFPKVYEKYSKFLQEDNLCLIKGRISIREDEEPKLLAEDIRPLKKVSGNKLFLRIPSGRYIELVSALKPILTSNRGTTPVYLYIEDPSNKKKETRMAGKELWVNVSDELLYKLYRVLGQDSVKIC